MLERAQVVLGLTEVFRETFDNEEIVLRDDMTAEDVDEWDSLSHIMLILAIEKRFTVKLSAAEIGKLENVGQMVDLVAARVGG
jgi:acyl carrier protein